MGQIGLNVYNILKVGGLLEALLAKPFLHADFSPLGKKHKLFKKLNWFTL